MKSEEQVGPPPPSGYLQVGVDADRLQVVVNHPKLITDADGNGFMIFSPEQAEYFAALLVKHARICRQLQSNRPDGPLQ